MPSFFRPWRPSKIAKIDRKQDRFRGSAHERGYDADWARLSSWYRREHPFCERCEEKGRVEMAVLVDHMIPVRHAPERRLDATQVWSLCHSCHAWKFRLERYAEAANKIMDLIEWCRDPEKRPKVLR